MSSHFPREVTSTPNVFFDADFKTFRLYAGSSMYCFCITPELSLEHLYWGTALPPGYDLRYLSQSSRNAHFNTVEAAPDKFGGRIVVGAETLEEVMKTYKESKTASIDAASAFQKRRLENYSWRILNKASQNQVSKSNKKPSIFDSRSLSFEDLASAESEQKASPGEITMASSTIPFEKNGSNNNGRRRSSTNPPALIPKRRPSMDNLNTKTSEAYDLQHPLRSTKVPSFSAEKTPQEKYLGNKRRSSRIQHHQHTQTFERTVGKMGKGLLCCEYSDHGTGDFRTPSFVMIDNANGSSISPLRYRRHAIYRGKLPMPDAMPAIRCLSEREASTLVVTMADINTGLEVDLVYGKQPS